ncbi:MAG: restriction endonuclease subunit S [Acidobacteria bacterium]|nr:restriction endonuclease subunit S [Acidobacteriota bacterium]
MSTSHWKRLPLSDIAEVRLGRQRSPKRAVGPNMRPYMRAANVTWNGISLHDVKEMDFTPEEFKTYALRRGDLLLSEASGSASEVGKAAIWNDEVPDCCFQNTLIRVRAPAPLVPFLQLHFYKDALTGEFARAARGVGIHHLGAKTLSGWALHLPPLGEQRRIVETVDSYLTRLDNVVATLERVRRHMKRYRASILNAAVEGRLVPTEAELGRAEGRDYEPASVLLERILAARRRRWEVAELARMKAAGRTPRNDKWKARYQEPVAPDSEALPSLPRGWCWASVEMLGGADDQPVLTGPFGTALGKTDFVANGTPVLTIGSLDTTGIDMRKSLYVTRKKADELRRYSLEAGDVLFSRMASVGRAGLVDHTLSGALFNYHLMRLRLDRRAISAPFFVMYVRGSAVVKSHVMNVNHGVTRDGINTAQLLRLPVPLPPRAEQDRITSEVDALLSPEHAQLDFVQSSVLRFARLRQTILKRAVEGSLVGPCSYGG